MENFKPPETHQPEEKIEKPSRWRKTRKLIEIAAFSALFSSAFGGELSAQQKTKQQEEDPKHEIEQMQQKAEEHVQRIVVRLETKGREGTLGEVPVREWVSSGSDKTTVGYNAEGQAQWLIHENSDASLRFFDDGADGSLDRVILNNEEPEHGGKVKAAFNDLKTFSSMDELAHRAEIGASLEPEDIRVFEIRIEGENIIVSVVDFTSGDVAELTGPEAEKFVANIQSSFANIVEVLDTEISN